MAQDNSRIDIVNEVLELCILAYPVSPFIISLYKQYQQRGSLSKKQLEGLYGKASGITNILPGKLATLEALIKRMPNRFKSELPSATPVFEKDKVAGGMIDAVLEKYPQHKRVVFFKAKYDNNEVLTPNDVSELKRFMQVIEKKIGYRR